MASNVDLSVDPDATVKQSDAGILGVPAIMLSVTELDRMLEFYGGATGFEVCSREDISQNPALDALFGATEISLRRAVLKAPNMALELNEFAENRNMRGSKMPVQGPGMTHTCFQTPDSAPGYDRFRAAGVDMLSIGDGPVDIGGYGVTYAYGYDPEGNLLEMEQLDEAMLEGVGYFRSPVLTGSHMWMSQVALVTHDLDRMMAFYSKLLGARPSRLTEVADNPKIDAIGAVTGAHLRGGWFRLDDHSKVLELWQYLKPRTEEGIARQTARSPGYSFAFEVDDLEAELRRLHSLEGFRPLGAPVCLFGWREVYCADIDGNYFSLRQALDPRSPFSVRAMDL